MTSLCLSPIHFARDAESFVLESNTFKEEEVMLETSPDMIPVDDKCFAWLNMKQM